ncbi:MAG: amidohydrolase family protein [Acidimicrobiales bacterium]|nr:amidohydrolase family protein [Acidimicrobiales bacterium]
MTDNPISTIDDAIEGRMLDCDGHLYMEPDVMAEVVGGAGASWIIDYLRRFVGSEQDLELRARAVDEVWNVKGISAFGSTEIGDRVRAMDKMGVSRQLIFPNTVLRELRLATPEALEACRRYNDYVLDLNRRAGERARVVCQVNMADPAWALAELARVVDAGATGVLLPCAEPPGGTSPANPVWDPLWRTFEESGTPALLHIGAGGLASGEADDPMLPPRAWSDSPTLGALFPERPGGEEQFGPFYIVVAHLAAEVYLTCLVMGGVFERFPALRFGAIEFGASWLGPLADRLDRHAALLTKIGADYPLSPSEYLRRNVRVTPQWTEQLDVLVERHGLHECYVFSTDYPHIEGGRHPVQSFREMAERVSPSYAEQFFVTNGELLLA